MNKKKFPISAMVLEDDAVLALTIEQALRDAGSRDIACFGSTKEAVDFLRNNKPELAVIDIHLADADDGYVIAEMVSLLGPKPPRIVFSTGSPEDIPAHIAKLGVVLEKPYSASQLVEAAIKKPATLLARLLLD